jgi:hypothetical protein
MGVAPDQPPDKLLGIGVEQQLVVVEAKAGLRLVTTVDAVAIGLTRHHVVEIAVPDILAPLQQPNALQLAPAVAVEQAKFHLLGICRKQREIGAAPVPGGAQRMRRASGKAATSAAGRKKLQQGAEQQG